MLQNNKTGDKLVKLKRKRHLKKEMKTKEREKEEVVVILVSMSHSKEIHTLVLITSFLNHRVRHGERERGV